ncbi:hypothetical protein EBT31_20885, partial [bacterium]|nr:hypothetical protein [bacterium]
AKYFDSAQIPLAELQRLLRSKAVLLPGVKVTLIQEKGGEPQTCPYKFQQLARGRRRPNWPGDTHSYAVVLAHSPPIWSSYRIASPVCPAVGKCTGPWGRCVRVPHRPRRSDPP